MPYRCSYCDEVHCETHRLPESHHCPKAGQAAASQRERRRTGHPGVNVNYTSKQRERRGQASGGDSWFWRKLNGKVAVTLMGLIVAVYVAEMLVLQAFGQALFERLFVLDANWLTKPWTVLTSIFAHGSFEHLLVNGIILFFFGPLLERKIGSKRFLYLVLAGGILAGLAQITFYSTFLGQEQGVVGISGALMAIMGTLTVLGPRLRVLLFFFIPAPLWIVTIGYALIDAMGFIGGGGGIAHLAHLTGLAIGAIVGYHLREQGFGFSQSRGQVRGGMQRRG
jgi:membrane associated rhomboid family serine protease